MPASPLISVVIPCFNEAGNLPELYERLETAFPADGEFPVEFILVDDGSTDETPAILEALRERDSRLIPVRLPERTGQTRALWQGLQRARGEWIGNLDGDLQNDPEDLPEMLACACTKHVDAVLGYRAERHDPFRRRLSSRFANLVRRALLGDSIRDIGCSTRIVRKEVLDSMTFTPNLHRYLPAVIQLGGWRIEQAPTHHHERRHGASKYNNVRRGLQAFRDLPRMELYIRDLQRRRSKERLK